MSVHKKGKLSRRMLAAVATFALVLFIFVSVFLGLNYYYSEMDELSEEAFAFARSAANYIDGDKVRYYLDNITVNADGTVDCKLDDYYTEVWNYLYSVKEEHEFMKYYYVFAPDESDMLPDISDYTEDDEITVTYLWDASIGDDASQIGDTEEYEAIVVASMYNDHPEQILSTYQDELWGNIGCAFYPIYDREGVPVAAAGVDLSMDGIRSSLLSYIMIIVCVVIGVVIPSSVVFYLLIRKHLVIPIGELNKATQQLVQNLDSGEVLMPDIHTHDELEDLANSFGKMDLDLKDYIKRLSAVTAEKERIGAELNVAAQIQADMLPRIFPAFPERPEFDIFATMTPAKEVGGDFYDFFLIDHDHIVLVMADVSGKGVPAALFMVIAKTLIKNQAQSGESPAQILKNVNEQLCEGNESELFVTVWLAIIDLSTGKGIAANAGHEHPALKRANGKYELVKYRHNMAVATMEGVPFSEHEFELRPGDSVFVYTDGVPEATDSEGNFFETDRMLEALNRDPDAPPEELLKNVREGLRDFVGEADQFDDITMMNFRYFGNRADETQQDKKGQ